MPGPPNVPKPTWEREPFGSSRTLLDGGTRKLNDVTTTKQHFDSGYDNYLAILASEYEFTDDDGSYWHYTQCINASCP